MAARNSSRSTRRRGREGDIRLRTHPGSQTPVIFAELAEVRARLAIAASAASVCGAALAAQQADFDRDAARVLQRCVADSLVAQVECLDKLIGVHDS